MSANRIPIALSMKTFLVFTLALLCGAAHAQTPASNPMPDGSGDLYIGLGVASGPRYLGASGRRTTALPLLQGSRTPRPGC